MQNNQSELIEALKKIATDNNLTYADIKELAKAAIQRAVATPAQDVRDEENDFVAISKKERPDFWESGLLPLNVTGDSVAAAIPWEL